MDCGGLCWGVVVVPCWVVVEHGRVDLVGDTIVLLPVAAEVDAVETGADGFCRAE